MFIREAKLLQEYFLKYQTDEVFHVKKEQRKNNMFYDFDEIKYAIVKDDSSISLNQDNYKSYFTHDKSNVYFIDRSKVHPFDVDYEIRKLNKNDNELFQTFHNAQPESEKNEGMVSLDDDVVFGAIIENKLVSVASTWNWGEHLADIGILTDKNYRRKGISRNVISTLINQTNKVFVYRCNQKNLSSNKLAQKIGFVKKGEITTL